MDRKNKDINSSFAVNITKRMRQLGFTQTRLAEMMGVSQAAVSSWCSGAKVPRIDKFDRLCEALEISRSYLLRDHSKGYEVSSLSEAKRLSKESPALKELFAVLDGMSEESIELSVRIIKAVKEGEGEES